MCRRRQNHATRISSSCSTHPTLYDTYLAHTRDPQRRRRRRRQTDAPPPSPLPVPPVLTQHLIAFPLSASSVSLSLPCLTLPCLAVRTSSPFRLLCPRSAQPPHMCGIFSPPLLFDFCFFNGFAERSAVESAQLGDHRSRVDARHHDRGGRRGDTALPVSWSLSPHAKHQATLCPAGRCRRLCWCWC